MSDKTPRTETVRDINRNLKGDYPDRIELERLRSGLSAERSSFFTHWRDLSDYILPRRSRFYTTDRDRGNRRNYNIINSTGTHAMHTLQAGMMSGFTSPSRPWFRLTTQDPDLAKFEPVKEWLYDVTWMMSDVFLRSNIYPSLQTVYGDMGCFGTAAMMIMEDYDRVIHAYPFVIGSYYLFADYKLKVNGFMRDFMMTVRQIVEEFAYNPDTKKYEWDNVSGMVKSMWDNGNTEAWIDVTHYIGPNKNWNPNSLQPDKKKYLSITYERGSIGSQYTMSTMDSSKVLRRRGYDKFRILAPRWEVSGEDVYGTYCPGMEALGDIQGLQVYERRGAQALEKSINPAMVGPASLRNQKATVLPGDITYLDVRDGQQKFEPAYVINPNFQQLMVEKNAIMERIKKSCHVDLFLVISQLDKGNVTAEEIRALQNEKLQEVGPVGDRLDQDLLDPLVELTFDTMMEQGRLPPAPEVLRKRPLKVEYTSIIKQAQKALSAGTIEHFWGFSMKIAEAKPNDPSVLDKVNIDELIERYGDELQVPPGIILDDDQVSQIRQGRQEAQAKQAQLENAEKLSNTAKNLAAAPTDGSNALTDLLQHLKSGAAGAGQ